MYARILILLFVMIFAFVGCIKAQNKGFSAMFYNVENYFDYEDDTLQKDEEFLPEGMRRWDKYKFYEKRNKIAKVLIAAGKWNMPALVGLAEIENRRCVEELAYHTPLKQFNYRFIHKESPDRRGIDVALLYLPSRFQPVDTQFLEVDFAFAPEKTTRDILYVKGAVYQTDTLHVFINHWPSRWGGKQETKPKRLAAARTLKKPVDSILARKPRAKIMITGDFNDYPNNQSLAETLSAKNPETLKNASLCNLSWPLHTKSNTGTSKYKGKWGMLDQIIVSQALLTDSTGIYTRQKFHRIVKLPFLLEKDDKNVGQRPNRTFIGYRFHGGFSDHLPVYLRFGNHKF